MCTSYGNIQMSAVSHVSPCRGPNVLFYSHISKCLLFGTCPLKGLIIGSVLYTNILNIHCFAYIPLSG